MFVFHTVYVKVTENALGVVPGFELAEAVKNMVASAKPPGDRLFPLVQLPLLQIENAFEIVRPFGSVEGDVVKCKESLTVPTFCKQMYCV